MKQTIIGLFCLMLLTTGQFNQDVRPKDIDPEDLPDVPAFQDEATREFLVSTEEVEPGFYLMESRLEGYQMLFPAGGRYLQDISSIRNQGNVETVTFEDFDEEIEIKISGQVKYHRNQSYLENSDLSDPEFMIDIIRGRNGYEGDFEKRERADKVIYYGEEPITFEEEGHISEAYGYVGYIESNEKKYLAIDYNFFILCFNDNEEICSKEINAKQKQIEKMIDSITFIYQEEVDRDE
ncbi:hypothetical protein [Amphibacillus cookii]|uniref:hypothetical protein n=1 Tax=Amphibacillus cookii TaxID=767787 RepID=UPI00195C9206|nr:hypothetical protein [Amphibacillus cookii]MBM7540247.1 hypothetical protein [Amphibacillus cookii]